MKSKSLIRIDKYQLVKGCLNGTEVHHINKLKPQTFCCLQAEANAPPHGYLNPETVKRITQER